MSIYRISSLVDDLPLEVLNKVVSSINEQYGIQLVIEEATGQESILPSK